MNTGLVTKAEVQTQLQFLSSDLSKNFVTYVQRVINGHRFPREKLGDIEYLAHLFNDYHERERQHEHERERYNALIEYHGVMTGQLMLPTYEVIEATSYYDRQNFIRDFLTSWSDHRFNDCFFCVQQLVFAR